MQRRAATVRSKRAVPLRGNQAPPPPPPPNFAGNFVIVIYPMSTNLRHMRQARTVPFPET